MKSLSRVIFILLLLVTLVSCDVSQYIEPVDPSDTSMVLFTVPKGASTTRVAENLAAAGLIQNDWSFKSRVKTLEKDGKLQAGDYQLSKSMSADQIIEKLAKGDVYIETFKFTIPEGYEFTMIVDRLEKEGLINREIFMDLAENHAFDYRFLEEGRQYKYRLEGFLYPATYELKVGSDELAILKAMLNQFDKVFTDAFYDQAQALGLTINEVVTLASIVERETKSESELPLVASVFHNRLNIGQSLQSCATVQYALEERKERLFNVDLEVDSPFNTYLHAGLPPAPIASPDAEAIEATLFPAQTDYKYFVVTGDNDGKHVFSVTYEEHLKAVNEYQVKLNQ